MQDTIIKDTGNSRLIKLPPNALNIYPTWEAFLADATTGGAPCDLSGPISAGCDQIGTSLNKANTMTDTTETAIWGNAANRTINQALAQLKSLNDNTNTDVTKVDLDKRVALIFTKSGTWTAPRDIQDNKATVVLVGGGGGGGGGGAGGLSINDITVTPGTTYTFTVGAGGSRGAINSNAGNGGNTTFTGLNTVYGGTRGGNPDSSNSENGADGGSSPGMGGGGGTERDYDGKSGGHGGNGGTYGGGGGGEYGGGNGGTYGGGGGTNGKGGTYGGDGASSSGAASDGTPFAESLIRMFPFVITRTGGNGGSLQYSGGGGYGGNGGGNYGGGGGYGGSGGNGAHYCGGGGGGFGGDGGNGGGQYGGGGGGGGFFAKGGNGGDYNVMAEDGELGGAGGGGGYNKSTGGSGGAGLVMIIYKRV